MRNDDHDRASADAVRVFMRWLAIRTHQRVDPPASDLEIETISRLGLDEDGFRLAYGGPTWRRLRAETERVIGVESVADDHAETEAVGVASGEWWDQ